jgi:predicted nucleic-acid-binding protein
MGWQTVKITADTNILVRAVTEDHAVQSRAAQSALQAAETVAVSISALCELVWVLSQGYKIKSSDIAETLRGLLISANVVVDQPAAQAGLAMLDAGGDFADGVIAYEGRWLGAETFVSFDRKAVRLMNDQGRSAHLLS